MIKLISAVSSNGIIGITENNIPRIPWSYPQDLKFFKEKTLNSTVIMGRATFQSIGRALPSRRNIVISSIGKGLGLLDNQPNIEVFNNMDPALQACDNDAWLIGGSSIYEEGMKYADEIYLTLIPEYIDVKYKKHAKFPWINPQIFSKIDYVQIEGLQIAVYSKENK